MPGFKDQLQAILPDLWRYAYALTRDRDVADDLVQDCIERALRKRHLHTTGRALRPWLTTMLLNLHRNSRRSMARHQAEPLTDTAQPSVAAHVEARIDAKRLLDRVAALPEEQRAPLLLVVTGGMSYAEAATALDIPLGTVMSRISRARAALRQDPAPAKPTLRSVR